MLVCPTLHGLTIRHMIIAFGILHNQTLQLISIVFIMLGMDFTILVDLLGILIYVIEPFHLYAKNLQTFNYIF